MSTVKYSFKVVGFKAELPKDFVYMYVVEDSIGQLVHYNDWRVDHKYIYVKGSYSKFYPFRKLQELMNYLFPEEYRMLYDNKGDLK